MTESILCPTCKGNKSAKVSVNAYRCLYCGCQFNYKENTDHQSAENVIKQAPPQQMFSNPVNVTVNIPTEKGKNNENNSVSDTAMKAAKSAFVGAASGLLGVIGGLIGACIFVLILLQACVQACTQSL